MQTLVVDVAGKLLLTDPMLHKKEAMDPVGNAVNDLRIPMVDLPVAPAELEKLLIKADAVIVTHTHRDHWDTAAQQMISKYKLVICQPGDEIPIKKQGFNNVYPLKNKMEWRGIKIYRTNGRHGTGDIGRSMGKVSGFVIDDGKDRLYIAGDTIWCGEVTTAIATYSPTHIVVNGGGARFLEGDPITMTTDDLRTLALHTDAVITIVHLDTVNHCLQHRGQFREAVAENGLGHRVHIPADGDWITV